MVAFEAAVGGGIPIIKSLREGLTANRIEWIAGIINGTSNFILSEMRDKGASFDDVLKEAQRLGYAEADPTFDIEGVDAAHKLTIMAAIGFGIPMQFKAAYIEGISKLDAGGHPLRGGAGLSHQAARHRQAQGQGHRAARAPDADPGAAADRQRRRRDERDPGEGRRGGADHVLRRRRRRRADRLGGGRRPGGRRAHADRRPRAPGAAPRVPARTSCRRRRSCRWERSRPRYYLRMRVQDKPGRAGRHHRASSPTCRSRSTPWCRRSRTRARTRWTSSC